MTLAFSNSLTRLISACLALIVSLASLMLIDRIRRADSSASIAPDNSRRKTAFVSLAAVCSKARCACSVDRSKSLTRSAFSSARASVTVLASSIWALARAIRSCDKACSMLRISEAVAATSSGVAPVWSRFLSLSSASLFALILASMAVTSFSANLS